MKGVLTNLLVLGVALGTALCGAEVILRMLYGKPVHFRFPQEYYEPDPEIGHRLLPGQRAYTHDKLVETNEHGLRDRDYPFQRPPEARRLLALGDSQTFGNGLSLDATWPKQLEAQLSLQDPDLRWEVVNAGIEATDTWQHERIFERLAPIYEIDAVVLAFYVNDVAARPKQVLAATGRTNTTLQRIAYLLKRSALATSILRLVLSSLHGGGDREHRVITGEPDPAIEQGWADVESALAEMKRRAHALGVGMLIAVLPRRDQVDGSTPAMAYNTRIAQIAERLGIPAVDMLEPLRRAWPEHGAELFIPWDGHNSAIANEIIAQELAGPVRALVAPASGPERMP